MIAATTVGPIGTRRTDAALLVGPNTRTPPVRADQLPADLQHSPIGAVDGQAAQFTRPEVGPRPDDHHRPVPLRDLAGDLSTWAMARGSTLAGGSAGSRTPFTGRSRIRSSTAIASMLDT